MKKILEFYKTHKTAITWTLCYITVMWAILYGLFNFNIFNGTQWHRLFHAQLRGFPGFVFGILILAALPLYVATTTLVIRNKKPLFTIPVPERIKKLFAKPAAASSESTDEKAATPEPAPTPLPNEMPNELRPHFLRNRLHMVAMGQTNFDQPYGNPTPEQNAAENPDTPQQKQNDDQLTELPLPTDFDIDMGEADFDPSGGLPAFSTPTFTDINFDTEPIIAATPMHDYLDANNIPFETENDLIITDKHVIATHTDPEFWIADEETWFAAGEKRLSPITQILDIAKSKNLIPVMYLGATNIMDLDKNTELWTTMGISVITSPDQLPK